MRSSLSVIVLILLSAALGAATCIGIALAAARWSPIGPPLRGIVARERGPLWDASTVSGRGIQRWHITRQLRYSLPLAAPMRLKAPHWLPFPEGDTRSYMSEMEAVGAGWPLICLHAENIFDIMNFSPTARVWRNGYVIEHGSTVQPFTAIVVPLGPVWKGLIVNTLVFSAGWLAFMVVVGMIRAHVRRCRGCCTRCGYDLRGSAGARCPECGGRIRSQERGHHRIGEEQSATSQSQSPP